MPKLNLPILYFLVLLLIFIHSCNRPIKKVDKGSEVPKTGVLQNDSSLYIDLAEMLNKESFEAVNVKVAYDPYFKKEKNYKGYYINLILDSIVRRYNFDTTGCQVVFKCNDGYEPGMDISRVFGKVKGYIVYKDMALKDKNWEDSIEQKFMPYYLVWNDVKKGDNSFTWPYGLTGIKLISAGRAYRSIYPVNDTAFIAGFNLFKNNCMECHSINKTGGSVGPEFNIPKNLTEYWREDDIVSFAKNPQGYRFNSRMPPVSLALKDSQIKEIISYIKYMKEFKLNHYTSQGVKR